MAPTLFQAAAIALRATSTICPASPTCPQDDQCTYTYGGTSLQLSCATDYFGGDLSFTQSATIAACMNACVKTNNCVAVSYVGQNCYLKSTANAPQSSNNVIGAAVTVRGPATSVDPVACPVTYTCPDNDGCTIQGTGSRTFALSCGTDFYGGDYTNLNAASLENCAQTCANDAQCVAASFVGGNGAGQCYLKEKNNGPNVNDSVDGIAIVTSAIPSSPVTSPSPVASTPSAVSASSSPISSSGPSSVQTSTPVVSSTPTPTPTPATIISNGGFEDGTGTSATSWQYSGTYLNGGRSNANPHTGTYSFQGQGSNSQFGWVLVLQQGITVVPGQAYTVSLWTMQRRANNCNVRVLYNNNYVSNLSFAPGTSWSQNTVTISAASTTSTSGSFQIMAVCNIGGDYSQLWVDDVSVIAA